MSTSNDRPGDIQPSDAELAEQYRLAQARMIFQLMAMHGVDGESATLADLERLPPDLERLHPWAFDENGCLRPLYPEHDDD